MDNDSLLTGENAAFLDMQYAAWLDDPNSVEPEWREMFARFERPSRSATVARPPSFSPRSIFNAGGPPRTEVGSANVRGGAHRAGLGELVRALVGFSSRRDEKSARASRGRS